MAQVDLPTVISSTQSLVQNTTYVLTGNTSVTTAVPFSMPNGNRSSSIILDGKGFTITINLASGSTFGGLFNSTTEISTRIQNLSLIAADGVTQTPDCGWFYGCNTSNVATVCNSVNYGNITGVSVDPRVVRGGGGFFSVGLNPRVYSAYNCINKGTSTARNAGGGIFGSGANTKSIAVNCYNEGNMKSAVGVGGIFGGLCSGTASGCYNIGALGESCGGIFGGQALSNAKAINCYNIGGNTTNNTTYFGAGGIFGYGADSTTLNRVVVSNCYSIGTFTGFSTINSQFVGGATTGNWYSFLKGCNLPDSWTYYETAWNDVRAATVLNGFPTPGGPYPKYGTTWVSTGLNVPYLLLAFNPEPTRSPPPCFLPMTRILTPAGYRRVDTLGNYDDIETSDGRAVPVKIYTTRIAKTTQDTAPYVIPRGAISDGSPDEDLHVSGLHAIQDANGMWQFPMALAMHKDSGVQQHLPGKPATYYHLECPNYFTDNLVANNCVAESFRNRQGREGITFEYCEEQQGFVRNREEEIKDANDIPSDVLAVYC